MERYRWNTEVDIEDIGQLSSTGNVLTGSLPTNKDGASHLLMSDMSLYMPDRYKKLLNVLSWPKTDH